MYQSRLQSEQVDFLCDSLVLIQSRDEAYRLLEDLCTIAEVQSLSQRLTVARMLHAGATYHQIVQETGASSATISRVNRCLSYGADGYVQMLTKLNDQEGR